MKKCKKCGAPLEGFLYNTIGKLMGIKPSAKDPEICNKCEAETSTSGEQQQAEPVVGSAEEKTAEPVSQPAAPETTPEENVPESASISTPEEKTQENQN